MGRVCGQERERERERTKGDSILTLPPLLLPFVLQPRLYFVNPLDVAFSNVEQPVVCAKNVSVLLLHSLLDPLREPAAPALLTAATVPRLHVSLLDGPPVPTVDVLVIGAGLSGLTAAYRILSVCIFSLYSDILYSSFLRLLDLILSLLLLLSVLLLTLITLPRMSRRTSGSM